MLKINSELYESLRLRAWDNLQRELSETRNKSNLSINKDSFEIYDIDEYKALNDFDYIPPYKFNMEMDISNIIEELQKEYIDEPKND